MYSFVLTRTFCSRAWVSTFFDMVLVALLLSAPCGEDNFRHIHVIYIV